LLLLDVIAFLIHFGLNYSILIDNSNIMSTPISIPGATQPIPEESYALHALIRHAVERLPLRNLKRMVGAVLAKNDPDSQTKLQELGLSAENLRAQLNHLIASDTGSVANSIVNPYYPDFDTRINDRLMNRIKPGPEGIIVFHADSDYWGDGWPGSITPDIRSVNTNRYMIIAIKYSAQGVPTPYVYFFETIIEEIDIWGRFERNLEMRFIETDIATLSFHQLIALAPSLYERIALTLGGPRELLQVLS
jgi:hypothetical protein